MVKYHATAVLFGKASVVVSGAFALSTVPRSARKKIGTNIRGFAKASFQVSLVEFELVNLLQGERTKYHYFTYVVNITSIENASWSYRNQVKQSQPTYDIKSVKTSSPDLV